MKLVSYLGFLAGLGLVIALVLWHGAGEITASLRLAGWAMLWLAPLYLVPLLLDSRGWRRLVARADRPAYPVVLRALWIGSAVNWLLPVAQIGGEVVKARLLALAAVPGAQAGASVVADKTMQAVTLIAYSLVGLCVLVALEAGGDVAVSLFAVTLLLGGLVYAFYRLQQGGLFGRLARLAARAAGGRDWLSLTGGAEALDGAVRALYGRRADVLAAFGWRLGGRVVNTAEVWLAFYLIGQPVGLAEAVLIESLGQAVRGAAFLIPGALGVQEGGYLLFGQLAGAGPEAALSMALMKRVRELLVGVPALLVWQVAEGRLLWHGRGTS